MSELNSASNREVSLDIQTQGLLKTVADTDVD